MFCLFFRLISSLPHLLPATSPSASQCLHYRIFFISSLALNFFELLPPIFSTLCNYVHISCDRYICVGTVHRYICVGTVHRYICVGTVHRCICVGTVHRYICVATVQKYICVGTVHRYICVGTVHRCICVGTVHRCICVGTVNRCILVRMYVVGCRECDVCQIFTFSNY